MSEFGFNLPTEILAGEGAVTRLPGYCARFGNRVLFVCPVDLRGLAGNILDVMKEAHIDVTVFDMEGAEPEIGYIDDAAAKLKAVAFDVVVGFGGGSAMDMAKALAIALTQREGIWMYANLSDRPPLPLEAPVLPVIAVPTTAGTGSEVTPYAVLSRHDTQQKGTVQEPAIFPKVAMIDGTLMTGMPIPLTAATGIDAFAHALEATINISKRSPMAELFGTEAMRRIVAALPAVLASPDDPAMRQEMGFAAALAGMSISHRGTTTAHAIAEPLGALTKIPHGLGVSLATVPVLRHSLAAGWAGIASLLQPVFGEPASGDRVRDAARFVDLLHDFIGSTELPRTVKEVIGEAAAEGLAPRLVDSIMRFKFRPLKQHPIEFDAGGLLPIVTDIIG